MLEEVVDKAEEYLFSRVQDYYHDKNCGLLDINLLQHERFQARVTNPRQPGKTMPSLLRSALKRMPYMPKIPVL